MIETGGLAKVTSGDRRSSLQLTPLWEYAVRTQSLPQNIRLPDVFVELGERLRNPEWEVRQHALRVIVDIIPIVGDTLDERMTSILTDVVSNLGHQAPAVRKGALDTLRMYLAHSSDSNSILQNIVCEGLENIPDNHLQSNVAVGIILSLPSLIFPSRITHDNDDLGYPGMRYIVTALARKLVQVTFQEVALRTLVKIKHMIGDEVFYKYLDESQPVYKKDFDLLCKVYGVNQMNVFEPNIDLKINDINSNSKYDSIPPDKNKSFESFWNSDSDSTVRQEDITKELVPYNNEYKKTGQSNEQDFPVGKIILTTEIKLNSATAIMMTIMEEKEKGLKQNSIDMDQELNNCDGVMKVLTESDGEEEIEYRRRTPRRVRFGGEVVKLRTPDSDTSGNNDENVSMLSVQSRDDDSVIEITVSSKNVPENVDKPNVVMKSHIPVPVYPATKKPDVKNDSRTEKSLSAPTTPIKSVQKKKKKMIYQSHPNLTKKYFENVNVAKKPITQKNKFSLPKMYTKGRRADDVLSPIPIHEEIEVLHNLQNFKKVKQKQNKKNTNQATDNKIVNSSEQTDIKNGNKAVPVVEDKQLVKYNNEKQIELLTTSNDDRDSLSSSSGSEYFHTDDKSWEELSTMEQGDIEDMFKEDWTLRVRGRKALLNSLRPNENLLKIEPRSASLLSTLLSVERNSKVKSINEDILVHIINNISESTLIEHLSQITSGLARMGLPSATHLSARLMHRLPSAQVTDQFLVGPLQSRSAKVRESALQLVAHAALTRPSSELEAARLAARAAHALMDERRRVRRAALELLAVLGQLAGADIVLNAVSCATFDRPCTDDVIAAVRSRLSRKQLPRAGQDGNVVYAPPGDGIDATWMVEGNYNNMAATNSAFSYRYSSADQMRFPQNRIPEGSPLNYNIYALDKTKINSRTSTQLWALDQTATTLHLNAYNGKSRDACLQQEGLPPLYRPPPHSISDSSSFDSPHHIHRSSSKDFYSGIPLPVNSRRGTRRSNVSNSMVKTKNPASSLHSTPQQRPPSNRPIESSGSISSERLPSISNSAHSTKSVHSICSSLSTNSIESQRLSDILIETPEKKSPSYEIIYSSADTFPIANTVDQSGDTISTDSNGDDFTQKRSADFSTEVPEIGFDDNNSTENTESYEQPNSNEEIVPVDVTDRQSINSAPAKSLHSVEIEEFVQPRVSISSEGPVSNNSSQVNLKDTTTYVHENNTERAPKISTPKLLLQRPLRRNKVSATQLNPFTDDLKPFENPKEAAITSLHQLESSDWETTMSGLRALVRLLRHHPRAIEAHLHGFATSLSRQVGSLRSQVARAACHASAEMFISLKKNVETETEELGYALLSRTADTNKFLRADAQTALDAMCTHAPPIRCIILLTTRGAVHRHAVVRCATARQLCTIVRRIGPGRVFSLPKDIRDRFLYVVAHLLTEGSVDTRNHAKEVMKMLVIHSGFQKALTEAVPATTLRHISKTLKSITAENSIQ